MEDEISPVPFLNLSTIELRQKNGSWKMIGGGGAPLLLEGPPVSLPSRVAAEEGTGPPMDEIQVEGPPCLEEEEEEA